MKFKFARFILGLIVVAFVFAPFLTDAATISASKQRSSYEVGDMVDVSFYVGTSQGETINAVSATFNFPSDKLVP